MGCRWLIFLVTLSVAVPTVSVVMAEGIPADSILVAQRFSSIAVLNLQGDSPGGFSPSAPPYDIGDVVRIPQTGEIVAADQHSRFRRYDKNGVYIGNYDSMQASFHGQSVAVGADGYVYGARQNGDNTVVRLNPKTGRQDRFLTIQDSRGLRGLTLGPDGCLYVVALDEDYLTTVRKIAADHSASTLFARSTFDISGRKGTALVFGPDGDLYVSLGPLNLVERFDGKTGASKGPFVTAGSGGLKHATGIMFHPKTGNLLVGSFRTDQILEYDGSTGAYIGVFAHVAGPWHFH